MDNLGLYTNASYDIFMKSIGLNIFREEIHAVTQREHSSLHFRLKPTIN
jgi:hypothetical protein